MEGYTILHLAQSGGFFVFVFQKFNINFCRQVYTIRNSEATNQLSTNYSSPKHHSMTSLLVSHFWPNPWSMHQIHHQWLEAHQWIIYLHGVQHTSLWRSNIWLHAFRKVLEYPEPSTPTVGSPPWTITASMIVLSPGHQFTSFGKKTRSEVTCIPAHSCNYQITVNQR